MHHHDRSKYQQHVGIAHNTIIAHIYSYIHLPKDCDNVHTHAYMWSGQQEKSQEQYVKVSRAIDVCRCVGEVVIEFMEVTETQERCKMQ